MMYLVCDVMIGGHVIVQLFSACSVCWICVTRDQFASCIVTSLRAQALKHRFPEIDHIKVHCTLCMNPRNNDDPSLHLHSNCNTNKSVIPCSSYIIVSANILLYINFTLKPPLLDPAFAVTILVDPLPGTM